MKLGVACDHFNKKRKTIHALVISLSFKNSWPDELVMGYCSMASQTYNDGKPPEHPPSAGCKRSFVKVWNKTQSVTFS